MATADQLRSTLSKYVPADALDECIHWITKYRIKVRIKKTRQSKYGDYRPPFRGDGHKISINHELNAFAFLITFTHEVAHLTCYIKYGNRTAPHGTEWKREFKHLLIPFIAANIFPKDLRQAVISYLQNPLASSCSDIDLQKALSKYDVKEKGWLYLEELPEGAIFKIHNGKTFVKGKMLRKNYECFELPKRHKYFIYPLMLAMKLSK